jgi:hypothetical protein
MARSPRGDFSVTGDRPGRRLSIRLVGDETLSLLPRRDRAMAVYLAARDLAGAPLGTHQFLIVVSESNPYPPARLGGTLIYSKDLGKGTMGYVIGAHNRGTLVVEYFEKSDDTAGEFVHAMDGS